MGIERQPSSTPASRGSTHQVNGPPKPPPAPLPGGLKKNKIITGPPKRPRSKAGAASTPPTGNRLSTSKPSIGRSPGNRTEQLKKERLEAQEKRKTQVPKRPASKEQIKKAQEKKQRKDRLAAAGQGKRNLVTESERKALQTLEVEAKIQDKRREKLAQKHLGPAKTLKRSSSQENLKSEKKLERSASDPKGIDAQRAKATVERAKAEKAKKQMEFEAKNSETHTRSDEKGFKAKLNKIRGKKAEEVTFTQKQPYREDIHGEVEFNKPPALKLPPKNE